LNCVLPGTYELTCKYNNIKSWKCWYSDKYK